MNLGMASINIYDFLGMNKNEDDQQVIEDMAL